MKGGGKTAVSAGTLKGILGFTAVGIRQEALLSDISARRWGGSSLDRCPRICDINVLDGNERESDREGEIRDGEMKEVADDLIGL